jgi:phenylpropionate dioxygenase-like ring-hydroxylating dioxygenase large terminal subunit
MGPTREMPAPPDYEWLRAPEGTHVRVSKTGEHCNWLQALEGGIDTAHSSFAHNNDISNTKALRNLDTHPTLEVDEKPWGFTYGSIRNVSEDQSYVRVYQFMMPNQQMRGGLVNGANGEPAKHPSLNGHIWVAIDDENVFAYNIKYTADDSWEMTFESFDAEEHRGGRGSVDYIPGTHWLKSNKSNDYKIDREVQRTKTFTGIPGINTQDIALQEGMGPICDRSQEHLGTSDKAIIVARQQLLEAIDEVAAGGTPRGTDPVASRNVRPYDDYCPRDRDWTEVFAQELLAKW